MGMLKAFKAAALKTKLVVITLALTSCAAVGFIIYGSISYFEQMHQQTLYAALDAINAENYPRAAILLTKASEEGSLLALEYAAWLECSRGNYAKAQRYAAEAAAKGSISALEVLGDLALLGYGKVTGAVAAVSYFSQQTAHITDFDKRNRQLGELIERALPLARTREDYLDLVLAGMDYNSPPCYLYLGDILFLGDGLSVNPVEAVSMWQLARDKGIARASTRLAGAYWHGYGVERDRQQALKLYQQAANSGDPAAYYALGLIALRRPGAQDRHSQNYQDGISLMRQASILGYAPANVILGILNLVADPQGLGAQQAAQWFEEAYHRADSSGTILYALMLASGTVVAQNRDAALVMLYDEGLLGSETAAHVLEALSHKEDPALILQQAVRLAQRIIFGEIEISKGAAEARVYHDGKEHAQQYYHDDGSGTLIDPKIYQIDGKYLIVPSIGGIMVQSQPSTGARLFDFTGEKPTPLPPELPPGYKGKPVVYVEQYTAVQ